MRATFKLPPAGVAGAVVLLVAPMVLAVPAENEPTVPPKFVVEGDQFVIKAGEFSLLEILKFLSDATSLPAIVGDPTLTARKEKVLVRDAIRLRFKTSAAVPESKEDPILPTRSPLQGDDLRPVLAVLREAGFDVQRVVLSSGKEVLEAVRIPLVNRKAVEPIVIPGSSHPQEPLQRAHPIFISEGTVPVGAFLKILGYFTGKEIVYQGAPGYEITIPTKIFDPEAATGSQGPTIEIPNDMQVVGEELVHEILEGAGYRVRRVLGEGGKLQLHVSPRPARPRESGLIRNRAVDPKAR